LQDVILAYYSGLGESDQDVSVYDFDLEDLLECMWNKEKAVAHSENFSGHIPYIDDEAAASLIGEYKSSQLFKFHDKFDKMYDLRPNMALYRTYDNARLSGKTHDFVKKPCPRALQPPKIKKFVRNLLESEWHPKHIGCLIDDLYRGNFDWNINWMKYPSKTRANFWARIYSAVFYLEEGLMEL